MPSTLPLLAASSGRLLVYNPDHDEALAANTPYYTPTKAAQLQIQLFVHQSLPWQEKGDAVWWGTEKVDWSTIREIVPFGWDKALCHRLRKAGAPEHLLPSEETLAQIRTLSSRQTAVQLLPLLRKQLANSFGEAFWATTLNEAFAWFEHYDTLVFKAPWSCAGRGVFRADVTQQATIATRVERIIDRQGGIAIEPYYDHAQDFALEIDYREKTTTILGINVFSTQNGRFLGNLERSCLDIPSEQLWQVAEVVQNTLPQILQNDYTGILGIDMMSRNNNFIHPCVEINLRRTMGRIGEI